MNDYVVNFEEYLPAAREDGQPWTSVRIEEAPTENGPWTIIDTQIFTSIDSDPRNPQPRSFSVTTATLAMGWYRVTFVDDSGNLSPTDAVQNFSGFIPTNQQIASLIRLRTTRGNGVANGVFDETTTPTADEVQAIAIRSAKDLALKLGQTIPNRMLEAAQETAALRAAMFIELTFWPEQIAAGRSPYAELKTLYDEQLPTLVSSVETAEAADGTGLTVSGTGMPSFKFPSGPGIATARW